MPSLFFILGVMVISTFFPSFSTLHSFAAQGKKHIHKKNTKHFKVRKGASIPALVSTKSSQQFKNFLKNLIRGDNEKITDLALQIIRQKENNENIVELALLTLGRLEYNGPLDAILPYMNKKSKNLKQAAIFLLEHHKELGRKVLEQNLAVQYDPEILAYIYIALSRDINKLSWLEETTLNAEPSHMKGLCQVYVQIFSSFQISSLPSHLTSRPILSKLMNAHEPECIHALRLVPHVFTWISKLPPSYVLDYQQESTSFSEKKEIIKLVGSNQDPAFELLRIHFYMGILLEQEDSLLKVLALIQLRKENWNEDVIKLLAEKIFPSKEGQKNRFVKPQVLVEAITTLGDFIKKWRTIKTSQYHDTVSFTEQNVKNWWKNMIDISRTSSSLWLRKVCLKEAYQIYPSLTFELLRDILSHPNDPLWVDAVAYVSDDPHYTEAMLISLWSKFSFVQKNVFILGAQKNLQNIYKLYPQPLNPRVKNIIKELIKFQDPGLLWYITEIIKKYKWVDLEADLIHMYENLSEDQMEVKKLIFETIKEFNTNTSRNFVLTLIESEKERNIVENKTDLFPCRPLSKKYQDVLIDLLERSISYQSFFVPYQITTTKGAFRIELLSRAPLNVLSFMYLVNNKYYSQSYFYRLDPGFILEGGDSRGDSFGGGGYLISDELSLESPLRGTVALATNPYHFGNGQFFINTGDNYNLYEKFTIFAKVISGFNVVEALEPWDKIIKIEKSL